MSSLLLLALVMVNVPVYLLFGKRAFGTWPRFMESVNLWLHAGIFVGSGAGASEETSADMRLGTFLACSAGVVLTEFFLLLQYVIGVPV